MASGPVQYTVVLTAIAAKRLKAISDAKTRRAIGNAIGKLQDEPHKRGDPLTGDLKGLYSMRAAGQRYRVIFEINESIVTITIVTLGIRKEGDKNDIYQVAKRMRDRGEI